MALLSLADFKSLYWHGDASDTTQDTRLTAWLAAWEDAFLEHIGVPVNDADTRTLDSATYTVIYTSQYDTRVARGPAGHVVPPVVPWSTTGLFSSSDGAFADASDEFTSGEYDDRMPNSPIHARVKLRPGYSFAESDEVKLVGTGGYSTVPDRFVYAFGLTMDWWDRVNDHRTIRSKTVERTPTASFRAEDLPPDLRGLMDALRMPWKRI